jgi:hypothetical protein
VSSPFLAKPPKAIEAKSLPEHLKLFGKRFGFLVWQIAVPFKFEPEPIDPFPELNPPDKVAEATVKQCQWIFDQSEQRRNQLEQKAQATFNLMLFLVPLLASTFVPRLPKNADDCLGMRGCAVRAPRVHLRDQGCWRQNESDTVSYLCAERRRPVSVL